jgi:ribosomal protein S6
MTRKDPILEEVWRARDQFAAECDYDMHKMFERMREITRQWKGKVVGEEKVLGKRRLAKRTRQGART